MPNPTKPVITPFTALVLTLFALLLLGCQQDTGRKNVPSASLESRVQAIENNPDIPPSVKTVAIQQLKAVEGGLQAANAAQKAEKKAPETARTK